MDNFFLKNYILKKITLTVAILKKITLTVA